MKKLIATAGLLLLLPTFLPAQSTDPPPRGLGYVFVGGATHSMGLTTGLGAEVYVFKGLGVGLEVGAGGLTTKGDGNYKSYLTGVGSADVSYHLFPRKPRGKASPFVTGGYTLLFGHNSPSPAISIASSAWKWT